MPRERAAGSRVDAILQASQQVFYHLVSGWGREQVDGPIAVERHDGSLQPPLRGTLGAKDLRRERQDLRIPPDLAILGGGPVLCACDLPPGAYPCAATPSSLLQH